MAKSGGGGGREAAQSRMKADEYITGHPHDEEKPKKEGRIARRLRKVAEGRAAAKK